MTKVRDNPGKAQPQLHNAQPVSARHGSLSGAPARHASAGARLAGPADIALARGRPLVAAPPLLQAKLSVNCPGDRYEQEADRVAEQVLRMPAPGVQRKRQPGDEEDEQLQLKPLATQITPLLQRQPGIDDEEDDEEGILQARAVPGQVPTVTPALADQIATLRGGGAPLPSGERAFFEPRFGYDFSNVRVHTDARAAATARAIKARAFTVGRDVVFGDGQYAPGTGAGRRLLGHELTHVVQQKQGSHTNSGVQRENAFDLSKINITPSKAEPGSPSVSKNLLSDTQFIIALIGETQNTLETITRFSPDILEGVADQMGLSKGGLFSKLQSYQQIMHILKIILKLSDEETRKNYIEKLKSGDFAHLASGITDIMVLVAEITSGVVTFSIEITGIALHIAGNITKAQECFSLAGSVASRFSAILSALSIVQGIFQICEGELFEGSIAISFGTLGLVAFFAAKETLAAKVAGPLSLAVAMARFLYWNAVTAMEHGHAIIVLSVRHDLRAAFTKLRDDGIELAEGIEAVRSAPERWSSVMHNPESFSYHLSMDKVKLQKILADTYNDCVRRQVLYPGYYTTIRLMFSPWQPMIRRSLARSAAPDEVVATAIEILQLVLQSLASIEDVISDLLEEMAVAR